MNLKTFDLETFRVNSRGEIIEAQSHKARYFTEYLSNGIGIDMVSIPTGQFMMGTDDSEVERLVQKFNSEEFRKEQPQHQVTVSSFFMGKYPITQAQWKVIASLPQIKRPLLGNPSHFQGDDNRPVEKVSWHDAIEFCVRLSKWTGKQYCLPSEAQWEYACRAGSNTPFYCGETITSELANYNGNRGFAQEEKGKYRAKTTPLGKFSPNAFGLYDMHGNVWEWCADSWHSNYHNAPDDGSIWKRENNLTLVDNEPLGVIRGGSWADNPSFCRSAYRHKFKLDQAFFIIGFRVACISAKQ